MSIPVTKVSDMRFQIVSPPVSLPPFLTVVTAMVMSGVLSRSRPVSVLHGAGDDAKQLQD